MKKNLYSLMLDDEVVRAVDQMAHRSGINRSALVNQILAERLELYTPERRISEVLQTIQALLQPDSELVPFLAPNALTMSLKSALDYKYRPTVKYEVALYRSSDGESIGEFNVIFRTQSAQLLSGMAGFFRLWKRLEDAYLAPQLGYEIPCVLYDGRFTRSIQAPGRTCSTEELAASISDYVHLFDRCLKDYLSGKRSGAEIEQRYVAYLKQVELLI